MAKKKADTSSEKEVVLEKPKQLSPFDIIKMMFTDYQSFTNLTSSLLAKNAFMINRIFAIKYPLQAQLLNSLDSDLADTVRSWYVFGVMKDGYGRVPQFVYTKTAQKPKEIEGVTLSKELINGYIVRNDMSMRDFEDCLELFRDEILDDLKEYEKTLSIREMNKNFKETKKKK